MMKQFLGVATLAAGAVVATGAMAGAADSRVDYKVTDRIAGADGGWDFARVDATRGVLYVARSNAVMAVDLATRKVRDLAPANGGHQVLTLDHGAIVVETDGKTNSALHRCGQWRARGASAQRREAGRGLSQ
jgi:hypothetical protein